MSDAVDIALSEPRNVVPGVGIGVGLFVMVFFLSLSLVLCVVAYPTDKRNTVIMATVLLMLFLFLFFWLSPKTGPNDKPKAYDKTAVPRIVLTVVLMLFFVAALIGYIVVVQTAPVFAIPPKLTG